MSYKIPTGELISDLQRVAEQLGRVPSRREMKEYGEYATGTYRNRFGAWSTALAEAGLAPRYRAHYSDGDLIRELWRMDREYTSPPKYEEMDEHGKYGTSTYENRFGSWNEALKAAGLGTRTPGEWVLTGEDHPRWKGYTSPYYGPQWEDHREAALERDGHQCTIPGCDLTTAKSNERYGKGLHVHHIRRIGFVEKVASV